MQRVTKKMPARLEIIRRLGGRCQWPGGCSVTDPDMLQVDHVYGGGAEERRSFGLQRSGMGTVPGGRNTKYYYAGILGRLGGGEYQLLCANHNVKKRAIEGCCNSQQYKGVRPCPCVGSIASSAMYR